MKELWIWPHYVVQGLHYCNCGSRWRCCPGFKQSSWRVRKHMANLGMGRPSPCLVFILVLSWVVHRRKIRPGWMIQAQFHALFTERRMEGLQGHRKELPRGSKPLLTQTKENVGRIKKQKLPVCLLIGWLKHANLRKGNSVIISVI